MSLWTRASLWFTGHLSRRQFDRDLIDELTFHIEARADDLRRQGLPAHEAQRRARLEFGSRDRFREDVREVRLGHGWLQLSQDVRLAIRSLRRSRGYFLAAVVIFGLAIAAAAAIFGAVDAVLLRPLPIQDPTRLIVGWESSPERSQAVVEVSYRNVQDWQASTRTLEHLAAFGSSAWALSLEDRGEPIRLATVGVSAGFFETLGVRPLLGRFLQADDDRPNPVRPLVLSHRLWTARFSADASVVGTTVKTGDGLARIIGVAPPDMDFPRGVDAWLPVAPVLAGTAGIDGFRDVGILFVIGRMRNGISPAIAATELERIADDSAVRGARRFGSAVHLTPFLDYQLGPVRAALWWLSAAVGVLLLIACGNVAALLLARASQRRREMAVRRALGACSADLWRQWVLESVLVSLTGGVAGLIAAQWLLGGIRSLAPDDVPKLAEMSVNLRVAAVTMGVCLVAALVSACAPMLVATRRAIASDLKEGAHSTDSRRSTSARSLLLAFQVGLSVTLLVAAGLIVRSYVNVRRLDLGFTPDRVVTLEIDSGRAGLAHNQWMGELLSRVAQLPDVESVGAVNLRPLLLGAIGSESQVVLEGQPDRQQSASLNPLVNYQSATPGYFRTMRIRLVQGRLFDARDDQRAPRVTVVSESTARVLWAGQSPIGKRLWFPSFPSTAPSARWRTVIGVVGDVRYRGLNDVRLDVYEPAMQSSARVGSLVLRSHRAGLATAAAVQMEARRMEPRAFVSGITSMDAVVDRATATWTLSVWMFGLFGTTAVLLVGVGLFSTVSLDAGRRSREFALRIALGARAIDIAWRALSSISTYVLAGTVVGLVAAVLITRLMTPLLFDVTTLDPWTYAGVLALTLLTVAIACYRPVDRAIRIAPASLLRLD